MTDTESKEVACRWRKWVKSHPWYRHYNNARERCKPNRSYGKRGIKFLMTIGGFEYLWKRDRADLMTHPSIDREDTAGNYSIENCRFVELEFNKSRRNGLLPWTTERRRKQSKLLLSIHKRNKLCKTKKT